jgi:hypothetical protein
MFQHADCHFCRLAANLTLHANNFVDQQQIYTKLELFFDKLSPIVTQNWNVFCRLAAKLLQKLCHERLCQEAVQEHQGIPILLSQLHCDNVNLLLPVLQCLIHMCTHPEANKEIRQMGGIPTILALLRSVTTILVKVSSRSHSSKVILHVQ